MVGHQFALVVSFWAHDQVGVFVLADALINCEFSITLLVSVPASWRRHLHIFSLLHLFLEFGLSGRSHFELRVVGLLIPLSLHVVDRRLAVPLPLLVELDHRSFFHSLFAFTRALFN